VHRLKRPFHDGTTEFLFEPLDFLARLAALVPRPRSHLLRYHGVLAPNARHRRLVVPAPGPTPAARDDDEDTPAPMRAPMRWIQRLRYALVAERIAARERLAASIDRSLAAAEELSDLSETLVAHASARVTAVIANMYGLHRWPRGA